MPGRFKVFPPRFGNVLIPVSSRSAALAGLAMYAPARWTGLWLQRGAWTVTKLLGPWALPSRVVDLPGPIDDLDGWRQLVPVWEDRFGRIDEMAAYRPRDPLRLGVAVLLISAGRPVVFVKVRKGSGGQILLHEQAALTEMWRSRPRSFRVAQPLGSGSVGAWTFVATEPLEPRMHRPPRNPPMALITSDIHAGLSDLPKPPGTPDHWEPMHGDLTPWNLRRTARDGLVLLDWETAGWGPPGSDIVLYEAASQVVRLGHRSTGVLQRPDLAEALQFWKDHWSGRIERHLAKGGSVHEKALAVQVTRILESAGG